MDILNAVDCYTYGNKIILASPGFLHIGYSRVQKDTVTVIEETCITFSWQHLNEWFNIFGSFLLEDKFEAVTTTNPFDISLEYSCEVYENTLTVEKKSAKKVYIAFNRAEAMETVYGLSHVFITSLCLPPILALCFNMWINHFLTLPVNEMETTEKTLKTMPIALMLDRFNEIIAKLKCNISAFSLCMSFERYEDFVMTLIKMRNIKKIC